MSKFKVEIGTNPNGSGARIEQVVMKPQHTVALTGSIHDMSELLFDLKEALRAHPLGPASMDRVAEQRRR